MNRLIDKENWAELLHGTPDGNGKERERPWNSVSLIHTCCYPVHTYPIHDQMN